MKKKLSTKGIIRDRVSKDRKYIGQKKQDKQW